MELFGLLWVGVSLAIGILAGKRGRGSGTWFVLSMLISPLLAGMLLMLSANLHDDDNNPKTHRKCPACAEMIKREAVKCKHCGSDVKPDYYVETILDKLTKLR